MGWKDLFQKKKPEAPDADPFRDLVLARMKPGYLVDYDLKSWTIRECNTYDWGGGSVTLEWQLESGDEVFYLEREEEDEEAWSLSEKVGFRRIDPDGAIARHILQHEDPPNEITYQGRTYYLEESGGGHFLHRGEGLGQEFLFWEYEDEKGKHYLTIEQWGEEDFSASTGIPVEEYMFTNILPAG